METAGATEKTLASLSPFTIEKGMKGISSMITTVKKLRSGALLIEVTHEAQANNLLTITEFASVPVKVSAHRTLNTTKGVIRSLELSKLGTDELVAELNSQSVISAQNIFQTREGQKRKTITIILTFALTKLPTRIKAGYESVRVDPFIPNPLRCFKCQQFGHGQSTCLRRSICPKCGLEAHGEGECSRTPHCVNCKGDHPAFAPACPVWQKEKEICKVKTLQGISFADAKKLVAASHQTPAAGVSYSSAAAGRKEMISVSTQTDIIECKCLPRVPIQGSVQDKSTSTLTVQPSASSAIKPTQLAEHSRRNSSQPEKAAKSPNQSKNIRTKSISPSMRDRQSANSNKNKKLKHGDRLPKGSDDPIRTQNQFETLEDMEGDFSDGGSQQSKPPFKLQEIKPPPK
jgi:hypothetical protein